MHTIKASLKKMLLAACMLLSLHAFATGDPDIVKTYQGSLGEIIPDDASGTNAALKEVTDIIFYGPLNNTILNPANDKITNAISLIINEAFIGDIKTDFSAQVTVKIDYTLLNGSTGTINSHTLEINYTKAGGLKYNQRQTLKFDQCRKVKVTILSVNPSVTSWNVLNLLILENRMQIKRDYVFNYTAPANLLPPAHTAPAPDADELEINWNANPLIANGKTHIDIEWTWVDEEAVNNYKKANPSNGNNQDFFADLIFKNNSSRITVSATKNSFKIPLLYDGAGKLFYRVRPAQLLESGQVVNGEWSANDFTGITSYTRLTGEGHQENLNWQTTTTFAEDGKNKRVIQYFDGRLLSRQTVTKDNVTNKTVVAEVFYDYQGRPAINILPAPTMNSVIKFTANFNKFTGNFATPKDAFDLMPVNINTCSSTTPSLDNTTGASNYYSVNNPEKTQGINQFIPDANGYPYIETHYTPDATGRIESQGGVGQTFQVSQGNAVNNHDTKYYYGKPDQKELDALFGTEAGDATHYSKNLVRDPNGQYSVSYVDMHGRTVATALAGTPPPNVKPLDSYATSQSALTKNLVTPANNMVEGRSVIASTTLLVTKAGPHMFHYEMSPLSAEIQACLPPGQTFCYDCYYDLEIRITGGCNTQIIKTATNLTFDVNGVPQADQSCLTQAPPIVVDFTEVLQEGEYNITKTLTVNKKAQDWYRENVYKPHNICKTLADFIEENYAIMLESSSCNITCAQCTAALGSEADFRRSFLLQQGYSIIQINAGLTVPYENEITQSYQDAKSECDQLCDADTKNELASIREAMLEDMSPGEGQYARLDDDLDENGIIENVYNEEYGRFEMAQNKPFNIFNQQIPSSANRYKFPVDENNVTTIYKGEDGSPDPDGPDAIAGDAANFANKFKPSWAKALSFHHPEFKKLQKAETTPSVKESYRWDALLEEVETWQDANAAGYIFPNDGTGLVDNDPFFNGVGAGYKATMIQYIKTNFNRIPQPNTPATPMTMTLWKMAWLSVFCRNAAEPGCSQTAPLKPAQFLNLNNGCDGDWNYVWRIFRTLYLSEKQNLINAWLTAVAPVDNQLLRDNHYELRFGNQNDFISIDAYMKNAWNQINAGDGGSVNNDLRLEQEYADNCENYKSQWIAQLMQCDQLASHPQKDAILLAITNGLKGVCVNGSDMDHPLGSSTVKPGTPLNVPQSFQEVITNVFAAHTPVITISALCHPDLIDYPQRYDQQAPLGNEGVVERKDSCLCTRLEELNAEKMAEPYFPSYASLSAFIKYKHGIDVRQTLIDSLTDGCNGVPNKCNFFDPSFEVPAIFSCETPIKNCITCAEYTALKTQFYSKFPPLSSGIIYFNPANADQLNANKAFAKFMNNKTGFSKTWDEYLTFQLYNCGGDIVVGKPGRLEDSVKLGDTPTPNTPVDCFQLGNIRNTFNNNYYYLPSYTRTFDANNCETSAWQFYGKSSPVFKDLFSNGIVSAPGRRFHFDYPHDICVNNVTTIKYRIKPLLPLGEAPGQVYLPLSLQTTSGARVFHLWLDPLNGWTQDCDECEEGPGIIYSPLLTPTYNQWMTVEVKFEPETGYFKIYINGSLAQERSTIITGITGITNISIQNFGVGNELELDYVDVSSANHDVMFHEDFQAACANFSIINPKYDCAKAPCDIAFTNYYNTQTGSNLTYPEIVEIYKNSCNIVLDACSPIIYGPNKLCGLVNMFPNVDIQNECNMDLYDLALNKATEQYQAYVTEKNDLFDNTYLNKCLEAKNLEKFTVTAPVAEYHYTLYYYDQAGNLVKTVPPAGVQANFNGSFLQDVETNRANGTDLPIQHNLVTQYRYNSLNQVMVQNSPDGGTSRFWYDVLGRLVVSQNAKQQAQRKFSYTKYDVLGRITEVGEKFKVVGFTPMTQALSQNEGQLNSWLAASTSEPNKNITKTVYDQTYSPICTSNLLCQQNLRNRVSHSYVQAVDDGSTPSAAPWASATFYTYDIHGNVDILLQDYNGTMGALPGGNRFKTMKYDYDLVSGKVNEVAYQAGKADAFYHRYSYDAENKITEVFTSHDYVYWEQDASYKYYRHGPLGRTVLGQLEVQGVDYAYTLQGWLKGINTTAMQESSGIIGSGEDCGPNSAVNNLFVYLRQAPFPPNYVARTSVNVMPSAFENNVPDEYLIYTDPALASCGDEGTAGDPISNTLNNAVFDMGQDGRTDAVGGVINTSYPAVYGNNIRTTDAYGFSLNYYNGDYAHIGPNAPAPFAALNMSIPTGDATNPNSAMQLFNGNIAAMAVNIPKLGSAKVYGYNYDQLNRIINMQAFNGISSNANTFTPTAIPDYKEKVSYDPNGNILTYKRNGVNAPVSGAPGGLNMDDLAYEYIPNTNKLKRVTDNPAWSGNYPDDIDTQTEPDNYVYDEIGNLVQDKAEGLYDPAQPAKHAIEWNVYGKIEKITKIKAGVTTVINYTYDAGGNRISKAVTVSGSTKTTYYVRDATGNVMSIYESGNTAVNSGALTQTEVHMYGSSRLGVYNVQVNVQTESRVFVPMPGGSQAEKMTFARGHKSYELTNHLGNVLVTISDKKLPVTGNEICVGGVCHTEVFYFRADVITATDYYPFGMQMPGRNFSADGYRYGFNGKEKDKEMHSLTAYDYGFRIYNPGLGRFLSVDPLFKTYPYYTPYQFGSNNPIIAIDVDGLESSNDKNPTTIEVPGTPAGATNVTYFTGTEKVDSWSWDGKNKPTQAQFTKLLPKGQLASFDLGNRKYKSQITKNDKNEWVYNGFVDQDGNPYIPPNPEKGYQSGSFLDNTFSAIGAIGTTTQAIGSGFERGADLARSAGAMGSAKFPYPIWQIPPGKVPVGIPTNIFDPKAPIGVPLGQVEGSTALKVNKAVKVIDNVAKGATVVSGVYDILKDGELTAGDAGVAALTTAQIAFPAFGFFCGLWDLGACIFGYKSSSEIVRDLIDRNLPKHGIKIK